MTDRTVVDGVLVAVKHKGCLRRGDRVRLKSGEVVAISQINNKSFLKDNGVRIKWEDVDVNIDQND